MIRIFKNLQIVPQSLIPAFSELFPERVGKRNIPVPRAATSTHNRRIELINLGRYIDSNRYNSRYKQKDVKLGLINIYNGKCAFCEQKIEYYHIEHYRPKSIYYWLAYSWDNLLMSCPLCNSSKGNNFEIEGDEIRFELNDHNLKLINHFSERYNVVERPLLINPEQIDPEKFLVFSKDGRISSRDPRFIYTIELCRLNRDILVDLRRGLLDRFRENIRDAILSNRDSKSNQMTAIKTNVRNFKSDSEDLKNEFLAFRKLAISEQWLSKIIKEVAT
ncbi:retron system putative HNH endonuclease [Sphingobacterium humi]|uniref:TIGR02646 family protein n=1 Tax=Sphingobacterium humi TaxID=1796905 RepID=A0A6N8L5N1_9SPHI|nr:retron system putative HNH endonuclease [Sphingobacterium humi]MVZ63488.1 TIGR02646 family protein [Sphingobacterium humi]